MSLTTRAEAAIKGRDEFLVSPLDLVRAAVSLDAEGCISIATTRGRRMSIGMPQVSVGNTHRGFIEALQKVFGGQIYKRKPDVWKPFYSWQILGRFDVRRFLVSIYPYLIIKKRQAALAVLVINGPCDPVFRHTAWCLMKRLNNQRGLA